MKTQSDHERIYIAFVGQARSLRAQMEMTYAGTQYEVDERHKRESIGPVVDLEKVSRAYEQLMSSFIWEQPRTAESRGQFLELALDMMTSTVTGIDPTASEDPFYAIALVRSVREALARDEMKADAGGTP